MTDTSELYRQMCDTPEIKAHGMHKSDWYALNRPFSDKCTIELVIADCFVPDSDYVVFLPDIRWYLERIPKPYKFFIEKKCCWVSSISEEGLMIFDDSLEIALLKVYMHIVHHKRWKEGKWVGI